MGKVGLPGTPESVPPLRHRDKGGYMPTPHREADTECSLPGNSKHRYKVLSRQLLTTSTFSRVCINTFSHKTGGTHKHCPGPGACQFTPREVLHHHPDAGTRL